MFIIGGVPGEMHDLHGGFAPAGEVSPHGPLFGSKVCVFDLLSTVCKSMAGKRGGGVQTGGFPDLDLSFFVLFVIFPFFRDFPDLSAGLSGDFPDLSFSSFSSY